MKITIELSSAAELLELSDVLAKLNSACLAAQKDLTGLDINFRVRNRLLKAGFSSIKELRALSDDDLMRIPNLGGRAVIDIRAAIARIDGAS
ncbi:DNA-directed RNA polymerase subunit alpha C-terminal domain-containing protein [Pseudoduganella sp. UC29_106]|uniref:DNA-directed RNA polymerase subunit alpha C-terminal domain-containing protein n=1 Tax=Pseudoduganella sp. UC29_106 TaxID=3374553 RepID=UPI003756676F